MGQTTDMAMIADLRKELEREAEEENIPILRRACFGFSARSVITSRVAV